MRVAREHSLAGETQNTRRRFFGSGKGEGQKEGTGLSWGNPLIQVFFFVFFTVSVVLLINVGSGITPLQVTEDAIGEPALTDVKASRDFTFVQIDPKATEDKRNEAAAGVPNVYDHHVDMREEIIGHVRQAFADVRRPLRQAEAELMRNAAKIDEPAQDPDGEESPGEESPGEDDKGEPGDKPKNKPPKPAGPSKGAKPVKKHDAPSDKDNKAVAKDEKTGDEPDSDVGEAPKPRKRLSVISLEALKDFRVRTSEAMRANFDAALKVAVISDEHFTVLARSGFSRTAEEALVSMINSIMQRRVVKDRRLLEVKRRGILLRRVRNGGVEQQLKVFDIDESFLSLSDLARELELMAPGRLREISEPQMRQALTALAAELSTPNTVYNHARTEELREEARASVPDLGEKTIFRKGQMIVRAGSPITARHVQIIAEMEGTTDARLTRGQILFGTLIAVLVLVALFYAFSRRNISKFRPAPRDLGLMGTLLIVQVGLFQVMVIVLERLGEFWSSATPEMLYYMAPLAFGAMIVRLANNSETAMIFSVLSAFLVGMAVEQSLTLGAFVLVTSLVGAHGVGQLCHRMDLLKAGLQVGVAGAIMALIIYLLRGEALAFPALGAVLAGFGGGLLCGIMVNATLPLVEFAFGYTTDMKLLELADLNHPAIKELILKAPGTYHHSVIVGTLAKEAAEAINANPLLARVGAYYHDIGKTRNPQYFAENQRSGQNLHDKLKPNMSALIIKAHVKDGLELARQHKLPREIQDFIAMHHGSTLIAYFYHRAKSMEDPDIPEVDEKDYRYPGPKPQTRETAIVMLADGIEAASRSMPEPTPARLKGLVQKMINHLFADGQLDECNLTLKDLNAIAKAFIRVLTSMYYTRPQYPGQEKNPGSRKTGSRKDNSSQSGEFKRSDVTQTGERKRRRKNKDGGKALSKGNAERGATSSGSHRVRDLDSAESIPLPDVGFDELPPMDIGGLEPSQVRITGPLPPLDQMMESVRKMAEEEEAAVQAKSSGKSKKKKVKIKEDGAQAADKDRSAAAPTAQEGQQTTAAQEPPQTDQEDDDSQPPASKEEDSNDHGADADHQSDPQGDEVGHEDGHPSSEFQDPPSLRRLGLS